MSKKKVYYNSACPVCDAGIAFQKKKLVDHDSEIEWIDVHNSNDAVCEIGAELEFVRERLHVVDDDGSVHVGSEAFAELWQETPGQAFLARIVRTPGARQVSWGLYNVLARLLYWWNRLKKRW